MLKKGELDEENGGRKRYEVERISKTETDTEGIGRCGQTKDSERKIRAGRLGAGNETKDNR